MHGIGPVDKSSSDGGKERRVRRGAGRSGKDGGPPGAGHGGGGHGGGGGPGGQTEGVKTLLGDPKKAIRVLAWPMILAMSAHTVYNLVDAIWVAGLGADALSAVGFAFPFFFMSMALATGLGIGGSAAISRRIGAKDKEGADAVATHTIVLMVVTALAFTFPLFIFARPVFLAIGAGDTVDLAVSYGRPIFAGTLLIFFNMVGTSILRGEGDAKRAMNAMVLGAVLNIALDPLFIFGTMTIPGTGITIPGAGMGVAGAAVATLISFGVTSMLLFKWLFIDRTTHVKFNFKGFAFKGDIVRDIFRVGLPGAVMQMSMAFTLLVTNVIIVGVAGTDGVAIYSSGFRLSSFAILPLLGLATANIAVCGAAFGAKDVKKLRVAFFYSIRLGLIMEVTAAIVTVAFASQIAWLFTWSEGASHLTDDLVVFLQIMAIFYPAVVIGMIPGTLFQAVGKGMTALYWTLLRTVVLTPPFALLFAYTFDLGLTGIWWGIVVANLIGATVAFAYVMYWFRCLPDEMGGPGSGNGACDPKEWETGENVQELVGDEEDEGGEKKGAKGKKSTKRTKKARAEGSRSRRARDRRTA